MSGLSRRFPKSSVRLSNYSALVTMISHTYSRTSSKRRNPRVATTCVVLHPKATNSSYDGHTLGMLSCEAQSSLLSRAYPDASGMLTTSAGVSLWHTVTIYTVCWRIPTRRWPRPSSQRSRYRHTLTRVLSGSQFHRLLN